MCSAKQTIYEGIRNLWNARGPAKAMILRKIVVVLSVSINKQARLLMSKHWNAYGVLKLQLELQGLLPYVFE